MIEKYEARGSLVLYIENEDIITRNHTIPFANCEYVKIKNVNKIEKGAFRHFLTLKKAILTKVKEIGDEAFYGCENLELITFNEGVKSIDKKAFWGCKEIKKLKFPSTLTFIGAQAFRDCSLLEEIKFSNDIKELVVGNRAFAMGEAKLSASLSDATIKKVCFPPNLNALGNVIFEGKNIESLQIFAGRRGHAIDAFNSMQCEELILSYNTGSSSDFFNVPDNDFIWDLITKEGK